eukprot:m.62648 g.62648  ORF g.62648 m.62648 type:complete len:139 (+) comp7410_c0_seq1:312-728(+)
MGWHIHKTSMSDTMHSPWTTNTQDDTTAPAPAPASLNQKPDHPGHNCAEPPGQGFVDPGSNLTLSTEAARCFLNPDYIVCPGSMSYELEKLQADDVVMEAVDAPDAEVPVLEIDFPHFTADLSIAAEQPCVFENPGLV